MKFYVSLHKPWQAKHDEFQALRISQKKR